MNPNMATYTVATVRGSNDNVSYTFSANYDILMVTCYSRANSDGTYISFNSKTGTYKQICKVSGHPDEGQPTIHKYIVGYLFNVTSGDKITFVKNGGYRFDLTGTIISIAN